MKTLSLALLVCTVAALALAQDEPGASPPKPGEPERKLYAGQVVFVREALASRGIEAAEELEGQVALETSNGDLLPVLPDWRGRAFFQDEQLRNRPVEIVGYEKPGIPYLQALMVFTFDEKGTRQYTDYWCDICSIPMYEIKKCECCQGPVRLRFQPQDLPDYVK